MINANKYNLIIYALVHHMTENLDSYSHDLISSKQFVQSVIINSHIETSILFRKRRIVTDVQSRTFMQVNSKR